MKNLIVFLMLLGNVGVVGAQYEISQLTQSAPYKYQIKRSNLGDPTTEWVNNDLITCIFPDGQYKKKLIEFNALGQFVPGSDVVEWTPYKTNATTLTGDIMAFVAKKGGSGTPPPPLPYVRTIAPVNVTVNTTNTPPAAIVIPPGKNCSLGSLWDFSQVAPNYLVVSYASPCALTATDYIEIRYHPDSLTVDYDIAKTFGNNSEQITSFGQIVINNITYNKLRIRNLQANTSNGICNNVYIRVQSLFPAGTTLKITAISQFCPSLTTLPTDSTYSYVIQGGPHDPNYKIVDIQTLPANQTYPVELTYTIQFHNIGSAPVKIVTVTDHLPTHLNYETFEVVDFQPMNGIDQYISLNGPPDNPKIIKFIGSGLPGLGQTSPSYTYDQTIFRFKFKVKTKPGIQSTINNTASIVFYDHINKKDLDPIITNVAQVKYYTPPTEYCSRWKAFWRNFFNIFRRDKKPPCRKPITGE